MLQELQNLMPDYAKDLKLNLSSVLNTTGSELTAKQIAGIALVSAYTSKSAELIKYITAYAEPILTPEEIKGVKAAASIMGMNNVYYRFLHLAEDKEFQTMPANLRMSVVGNPGIPKLDFEFYSLAASAINGCGLCISSHVKSLIKAGASKLGIQHSVRIAAVLNGAAQVLAIPAA